MKKSVEFAVNRFYVVVENLVVKDLAFIVGEIVGVVRFPKSRVTFISKTGLVEAGFSNHLDVHNLKITSKLRKLTTEEVFKLAGGYRVTSKDFASRSAFARVCRRMTSRINNI